MRLVLVRHGLSSFNRLNKIQGRNDLSTLTEEGKQQAQRTGKALAKLPIKAIYSSPLQRAAQTTINLLNDQVDCLKPTFDNDLLEVDLEPWSGLTQEEVKEQYPEEYKTWLKDPHQLFLTKKNGHQYEPIKELLNQAQRFIDGLLERHNPQTDETVVVVAHNAILRCLVLLLIGNKEKGIRRIQLNNASISIFNLTQTNTKKLQVQIECLNSIAHLNPTIPKKGKKSRIILVRHGETDWNLQGRFQGQIDIPLNSKGLEQASSAGQYLSNLKIDQAFSSSMTRPKQTAQAILKYHPGVKIVSEEDLIEIGHGLWEGKLESEIQASWPELLESWKKSPDKVQMPEGENIQEVWERAVLCWQRLCNSLSKNETALVVAHDAVNKTILCHLLGLSPADIWMVKQGNGGVSVIDLADNQNESDVVTCLNLTSHLGSVIDQTAAGAL